MSHVMFWCLMLDEFLFSSPGTDDCSFNVEALTKG